MDRATLRRRVPDQGGRGRLRVLLVMGVLLCCPAALARGSTSVLTGNVIDASTRAPMGGVVVTATSPSLQGERVVITVSGTINLSYHPKNLRFLSGARYQGSTFEGDVDATFGTCTGSYKVQGLTPSPIGLIGPCVDDSLCDPFGDPAKGIFASGINPDYAVACVKADWVTTYLTGDPSQGLCFFTKPFPGLK